jgi:hypothetical protein
MLTNCTVQGSKSPVKNLVTRRCAEGFNSGVKGLNKSGLCFVFKGLICGKPVRPEQERHLLYVSLNRAHCKTVLALCPIIYLQFFVW